MPKRLTKVSDKFDKNKIYSIDQGLELFKTEYLSTAKAKFDETLEVVIKLGIDPKQTDQQVRGVVSMPNGLGKTVKVLVFVEEELLDEAAKSGADHYGSEDLIQKVKDGFLDFDVCISTPAMMTKVGLLGKVLGPKGLMPNPKLGTVSKDVTQAVKAAKAGQVEYKTEKAGLVHAGIGKLSFDLTALKANFMALYNAVVASKPSTSKGVFVQKIYLSVTMGKSLQLDLQSLVS